MLKIVNIYLQVVKKKHIVKALEKFQTSVECLLGEGGEENAETDNLCETTDRDLAETSEVNSTVAADLTESEETLSQLATSFTATRVTRVTRKPRGNILSSNMLPAYYDTESVSVLFNIYECHKSISI